MRQWRGYPAIVSLTVSYGKITVRYGRVKTVEGPGCKISVALKEFAPGARYQ